MLIKRRSRAKKNGFTLVELIVVIAIIGILAGMMLPRLGTFTTDAKKAAFEGDVKSLMNMITLYQGKHGELPPLQSVLYATADSSAADKPANGTVVLNDSGGVGSLTITGIKSATYDIATTTGTAIPESGTESKVKFIKLTIVTDDLTAAVDVKTGVVAVTENTP